MIKLNTKDDWKALMELLKIVSVIFAIIYLIGTFGAYENDAITTTQFILRCLICIGLVIA